MRILIADGESACRELLKVMCRGHRISEAKHSTDALRLSDKVDLILTDIGFPGLSGDEYINALKRRSLAKIIVITAWIDYENTKVDDIILKPIDRKTILSIIDKYDTKKS